MQGLVGCRVDDDIRPHGGRRKLSDVADAGIFLSLAPRVDVFLPPLKRTRVSAPFIPRAWEKWASRTEDVCSSLDALKDECLLEILKRLDGDRERSIAACVSKRWLALLGTSGDLLAKPAAPCAGQPKTLLPDLNETAEAEDEIEEDKERQVQSVREKSDEFSSRCLEGMEATDIRLLAMAVGASVHGGVGKLSIRADASSGARVTDLGLCAVARHSPRLRVLSLWNTPYITDKGLSLIASRCPLLEKLDLSRCPLISDKGISAVAAKCPRLASLAIESCPNVGDDCLWAVGHFCANLRSVSIADSALVGDKGVANLLTSASSLRKIILRRLRITDLSLAVVGHYGNAVVEILLADLPDVTERGLWVMGCARGLRHLSSLSLINSGATDLGLEAVARGCPSLKRLSLRRCSRLSDSGLLRLSAAASSLEALQLEECDLITLPGVVGALLTAGPRFGSLAVTRCPGFGDAPSYPQSPPSRASSLRSLCVADCPGLGDPGLLFLGKLCNQLRRLRLSALLGVSDASLIPLFQGGCREGLRKVDLSDCANVTDAAVSALAGRHGGTLRSLNLAGCKKVTDQGLDAVAMSCFRLEDLDMSGSSVADAGVAALATSAAARGSLRVLSLAGCADISGRSLGHLSGLCQSLVGLNLQLCASLTAHDVASLQSGTGQCDVLA